MFKLILLVAFIIVLGIDFLCEITEPNPHIPSIIVRTGMIFLLPYLLKWF